MLILTARREEQEEQEQEQEHEQEQEQEDIVLWKPKAPNLD